MCVCASCVRATSWPGQRGAPVVPSLGVGSAHGGQVEPQEVDELPAERRVCAAGSSPHRNLVGTADPVLGVGPTT